MIDYSLEVDDPGVIDAYAALFAHAGAFVETVTRRTLDETIAPVMLPDFQQEPGSVKHPIQWTSAKQRRYVKMKQRKGEIKAPYVRTHAVSRGWKLFLVQSGTDLTSIKLENNAAATDFVEGKRQQQFHKNTGWLNAGDLIQEWLPIVTDEIETALIKAFYAVGS